MRDCTAGAESLDCTWYIYPVFPGIWKFKETVDASHQAAYTISTIIDFTMQIVAWVVGMLVDISPDVLNFHLPWRAPI